MDRADAQRLLGADPAEIEAVEAFAEAHGLSVQAVDIAARSMVLAGTVAQMDTAFQVRLGDYEQDGAGYRGREGAVYVPVDLLPAIVAVLGLDNRPQTRALFRRGPVAPSGAFAPHAAGSSYSPQQVAQRYRFPAGADGSGQTVAVIELGGGYRLADLRTYFTGQGLRTPRITAVAVDGARNTPGGDADGEVALDVEVIGAIAPGARQAVYFGRNTTDGFYNAIAAAVHDHRRAPSVISISWGGPESSWTAQSLDAYDALFADAGVLGISVFVAAGDDGATDKSSDGSLQVDFPASSPQVVACGGTTLTAGDETVWDRLSSGYGATGGGVSRHFPVPAYQARAGVPDGPTGLPGRGVPDVAGDADPLTGYQVRVDGVDQVIGGTSAVAPLWAAFTAIANQLTGRPAGDLHTFLYGPVASGCLRDIVTGTNGHYRAVPGWDPCTGLGTPIGESLAKALRGQAGTSPG
jgi:kumamolisin